MKKLLIFNAVLFVAVVFIFSVLFPRLETMQEYNDFFVWDKAFFMQKMSDAPGVTSWLECLTYQAFRWPLAGALIEAFLLVAMSLVSGMVLKRMEAKSLLLALVPVLGILTFDAHNVGVYLQYLVFTAALWVFLSIKKRWLRWTFTAVWMLMGYVLLTWFELVVLLAVMTVMELKYFKSGQLGLALLAGVGILMADVAVYTEHIAFVPFNQRYYFIDNNQPLWLFIGIYLLYMVLAVLPEKWFQPFKRFKYAMSLAMGLLMAVSLYFVSFNKLARYSEEAFSLTYMADAEDWKGLLESIPRTDAMKYNKYYLMYALMAESAMGQLPEHLMYYPITSSMQFKCIKETKVKYSCEVNRQFYALLGLYDEALRQAFEYGVCCEEGYCFGSMRKMVEYAALEGNNALADKYLNVLDNSSLHGSFVKEWREKLKASKKKATEMVRADNFAGAHPFNSEMVRYFQLEPQNQKFLDYLLCGLLLERKLPEFKAILDESNMYKAKQLPKLYAEALAMLNVSQKTLHEEYDFDTSYDADQARFLKALRTNDIVTIDGMKGTYFYYCFSTTRSDAKTGASVIK